MLERIRRALPWAKTPDVALATMSTILPLSSWDGATTAESLVKRYGQVGWVFACAALISSRVGAVTWGAHRGTLGGESEPLDGHPALDLLNAPNPFMSRMELLELSQVYFDLAGEFFWNIVTPGAEPAELWPINPSNMQHVPDRAEWLGGWVHEIGRNRTLLGVDQVLHQRRPSPTNQYRGQSIIEAIAIDADSDRNVARWTANFFRNSAQPGGVIEVDDELTDAEYTRLREQWESRHQGQGNAHRVALLEGGAKYKPNEVHLRNLQVADLRNMNEKIILAAFNVSPANLGIVDDVNRANAEAAAYQLAINVIEPRLVRIRESVNRQLVPRFPGSEGTFLNFISPVPADRQQGIDMHINGWNAGLTRRNTALTGLGLPAEVGAEGEEFKIAASPMPGAFGASMMIPIASVAPAQHTPPAYLEARDPDFQGPQARSSEPVTYAVTRTPDPDEQIWKEFVDALTPRERAMTEWLREEFAAQERDTVRALRAQTERTYSRMSLDVIAKVEVEDVFDETRWIESAIGGGEAHVEGALTAQAAAFAAQYGFAFDTESDEVLEWIGSRLQKFSKGISSTTRNHIQVVLRDGQRLGESIPDLTKRVQGVFEDASKRRATMIARTEIVSASNQGKLESAVQSEVVEAKVWFAALDERVRDTHREAHGQQVGLRELFQVGADFMQTPGGGNLAGENINCRCTWQEVLADPISENALDLTLADMTRRDARCPDCGKLTQRDMPVGLELWCHNCKESFVNER